MDGFETYIAESVPTAGRTGRRLALYLGLAVLLAAATLVAVNSRGGSSREAPAGARPGSQGPPATAPRATAFGYTQHRRRHAR